MIKKIFLLFTLPIFLSSCATLKKPSQRPDRTVLTNENLNLLNGTYKRNSSEDNKSNMDDLLWVFFVRGQEPGDRVKLDAIDINHIKITVLSESRIEKTKIYKGKIKGGQLVLNRKIQLWPLILANLYRKRNARLGLLDNGDLLVDAKISLFFLTFMLPIPVFNTDKVYDNSFKKIESDSLR